MEESLQTKIDNVAFGHMYLPRRADIAACGNAASRSHDEQDCMFQGIHTLPQSI